MTKEFVTKAWNWNEVQSAPVRSRKGLALFQLLLPFLVAGLLWIFGKPVLSAVVAGVGLFFLLMKFLVRPAYELVMRLLVAFGTWLGRVISHVALTVVYVTVFTPVGFVARLFHYDVLDLNWLPSSGTHWRRTAEVNQTRLFDRPFLLEVQRAREHRLLKVAVVILILLLAPNAILFLAFEARDFFRANPVAEEYGDERLRAIYPDLTDEQISELLDETWSRPYVYEPFTQFSERPIAGKYVNVDKNGFRHSTNQGPWPPDPSSYNVFLFGGSTTFNYGIRDEETIASHLQKLLSDQLRTDVRLYNFGRGYYFSTQELILFEKLLGSGAVPKLAIFIDGLNDFYYATDEPKFTERLYRVLEGDESEPRPSAFEKLPVWRAALWLEGRVTGNRRQEAVVPKIENYDDAEVIANVIARYRRNKKMIEAVASAFEVRAIFAWQPGPTYKYDLRDHLFGDRGFGAHTYSKYGYPKVAQLAKDNAWGENFLWCADIQEGRKEALYVDLMHYSAKLSEDLAHCIGELMLERTLLD